MTTDDKNQSTVGESAPVGASVERREGVPGMRAESAKQRFRLILAHADHEPTIHCLSEIMLHAKVGLAALTPSHGARSATPESDGSGSGVGGAS